MRTKTIRICGRAYPIKGMLVAMSFVLPCIAGFALFYMLPTIRGLLYSLTDWDLFSKARFVGLKNYMLLFRDKDFWEAMRVTVCYVLLNIPLQTVLAMVIALIMNRANGSEFMRGVFLVPWIMSNVVVGLLWLWMMDPAVGVIDAAFVALGLPKINFLTDTKTALPSVALINIWRLHKDIRRCWYMRACRVCQRKLRKRR